MKFKGELIKKGSLDAESVKAIKVQLNLLIGTKLDINNGNFGTSTEDAVKKFQKSRGLLADGIVGSLTWDRLFVKDKVAVKVKNIGELSIVIAKTQLHVRELTGNNDGVAVERYLKSVGLGKGYPYCQAFAYDCMNVASYLSDVANPMPKTAGVLDLWSRASKYRVKEPQVGDQFIIDFGGGKGHTGFITKVDGDFIETVEGNTNGDNSREGDGVYERRRKKSTILGYLRWNV